MNAPAAACPLAPPGSIPFILASHDDRWAGVGVQIVRAPRTGSMGPWRPRAGCRWFVLAGEFDLFSFTPRELTDRPRRALCRLTLVRDEPREQISSDADGLFRGVHRRYEAVAERHAPIQITPRPALAKLWMSLGNCPTARRALRRRSRGSVGRFCTPGSRADAREGLVAPHGVEGPALALFPPSPAGKRAFDAIFAACALALTAPLFPLIMLAIWLEDGRPWFFAHTRQTLKGRSFACYKFRTMRRGADRAQRALRAINTCDGPQFKSDHDPRTLRVGKVLRALCLDELPQFWNVLRGDMSVVGPRPSPDNENQFCPPWRRARLSVRAGITGLWQVRRTRKPLIDFQEWIRYDVMYAKRQSWGLDLLILLQTPAAVLRDARLGQRLARLGRTLFGRKGTAQPTPQPLHQPSVAGRIEPAKTARTPGRREAA